MYSFLHFQISATLKPRSLALHLCLTAYGGQIRVCPCQSMVTIANQRMCAILTSEGARGAGHPVIARGTRLAAQFPFPLNKGKFLRQRRNFPHLILWYYLHFPTILYNKNRICRKAADRGHAPCPAGCALRDKAPLRRGKGPPGRSIDRWESLAWGTGPRAKNAGILKEGPYT